MIIMGIDPGLAIVGYGVIDYQMPRFRTLAYGAVTTPAHTEVGDRLVQIFDGVTELIERYHPADIAVEELFFTNNITTGISVAEARGVILLAARKKSVHVFEYTPMQVKQAVVGYGKAEKRQVMEMTRRLLHMEKVARPDDAADAIAIALCHARSQTSLLARLEQKTEGN
jgi:crossover junction endodeoxyribonuclease RuvC